MHHIVSEKNERKMLFYLTFAAHCVRHFISSVQSGKTEKKREKWITSKGHPHNFRTEGRLPFEVLSGISGFFLLNGKRPLRSHDVHVLNLEE